jgi:hypothetical protein
MATTEDLPIQISPFWVSIIKKSLSNLQLPRIVLTWFPSLYTTFLRPNGTTFIVGLSLNLNMLETYIIVNLYPLRTKRGYDMSSIRKDCKICGNEFETNNKRRKYCYKKECHREADRRRVEKHRKSQKNRYATTYEEYANRDIPQAIIVTLLNASQYSEGGHSYEKLRKQCRMKLPTLSNSSFSKALKSLERDGKIKKKGKKYYLVEDIQNIDIYYRWLITQAINKTPINSIFAPLGSNHPILFAPDKMNWKDKFEDIEKERYCGWCPEYPPCENLKHEWRWKSCSKASIGIPDYIDMLPSIPKEVTDYLMGATPNQLYDLIDMACQRLSMELFIDYNPKLNGYEVKLYDNPIKLHESVVIAFRSSPLLYSEESTEFSLEIYKLNPKFQKRKQ